MQRAFDEWISAERGRFILFLPVFMGAGVLVYFGRTAEPAVMLVVAPLAVAVVATVASWRWPMARAAALCVLFAAAGFADAWWESARAPAWDDLPRGGTLVSGTVLRVESLPKGRRVLIQRPVLDGVQALGRDLRLRLRGNDALPIAPGDVVAVRALVQSPSPPDVPGGWDTQREAFFSGMGGYGFAIGQSRILSAAPRSWWRGVREKVAMRIAAVLPGTRGAIAATLLTGFGSAIPADDRAAFQDSGLAHLLAVAGLHIGIVMGLVFTGVRFAFPPGSSWRCAGRRGGWRPWHRWRADSGIWR